VSDLLLIEDDADIRMAVEDLLSEAGYTVRSANNGDEGLARLSEGPPPAVILLDLMMPVLDGFEFRRRQLADPRIAAVPVVALTADRRVQAAELGAAHVVRKPFTPDQLLSALRRAISPQRK
jgi:CheY-like chemotaxis protein